MPITLRPLLLSMNASLPACGFQLSPRSSPAWNHEWWNLVLKKTARGAQSEAENHWKPHSPPGPCPSHPKSSRLAAPEARFHLPQPLRAPPPLSLSPQPDKPGRWPTAETHLTASLDLTKQKRLFYCKLLAFGGRKTLRIRNKRCDGGWTAAYFVRSTSSVSKWRNPTTGFGIQPAMRSRSATQTLVAFCKFVGNGSFHQRIQHCNPFAASSAQANSHN